MRNYSYSYIEKVESFLTEYVLFNHESYDKSGHLSNEAIEQAMSVLIGNGIFATVEDIRRKALEEYQIILPYRMFEDLKDRK